MTKNNYPKISVIIGTHNHAHFLSECLNSVKSQVYKNYEVIVVDNGSTDNTKEVIEDLAWDKLNYYYQKDTGSVASPRNTGIRIAKGKYIAFLDSDDLWYSQKLKKIMEVLEVGSDIDIISHHMWLKRMGRKRILLKAGPIKKDMFKFLLTQNRFIGSATVIKKDILLEIGGFDERKDFVHVEDYETWLRIAFLGKKFAIIDKALGEYRIHDSNLSHDFQRALLNEINVVNKHFRNCKTKISFYKLFLRSIPLSRVFLTMGVRYFLQQQYLKGFLNILKSLFINPSSLIYFLFTALKKKLLEPICLSEKGI